MIRKTERLQILAAKKDNFWQKKFFLSRKLLIAKFLIRYYSKIFLRKFAYFTTAGGADKTGPDEITPVDSLDGGYDGPTNGRGRGILIGSPYGGIICGGGIPPIGAIGTHLRRVKTNFRRSSFAAFIVWPLIIIHSFFVIEIVVVAAAAINFAFVANRRRFAFFLL
uniref:Uncharacterized protein n=1 Tax=Romanomermis culicivorax TaxID=13658 RepID=A0A915J465_ROMCU